MAQYRGMHFIRVLQLIFALNVVKIVGGSVTITESGTEAGNGAYECGEKLTLTCEISGNPNTMSWQNDSSNIPLAQCVFQNCELNPDVVGKFEFSFNNSIGVYNLTFDVMNENNGISYMCEDGTDFSQTIITVKDLKPTLIKTDQQRLKAVSGCIDPNEKVTFTWKKIQATNNEESQYHTSCLNEQEFDDTKTCQSDTKCGGPNLIQKLMSIDDEEGGPDDYYLKVVLSYNGVEMESALTNDTHKVNCLVIPPSQTHTPSMNSTPDHLDKENTTLANIYTTHFTNKTSGTPGHSDRTYMPIVIGAGVVGFVFIFGLSIF